MIKKKLKQIGAIAVLSSALLFTNCNARDLSGGGVIGAVATALSSYTYPRYYDRPYYYDGNRYYYGGYYRNGYYVYRGKRFRNGHYYDRGYRYYRGHRYPARVGNHGYYRSQDQYKKHHRSKRQRDIRKRDRRDRR